MLYPVFLARNQIGNQMVARVVAKRAKTTKVKNISINCIKSSKEYAVVFLVEGEKFNLGENVQARSSNLPLIGLHLCCRFCCKLGGHTA